MKTKLLPVGTPVKNSELALKSAREWIVHCKENFPQLVSVAEQGLERKQNERGTIIAHSCKFAPGYRVRWSDTVEGNCLSTMVEKA